MTGEEPLLLELADAILDGRPIDWTAAAAGMSDSQRLLLDHFQSIASVSSFHVESSIGASVGTNQSAGTHLRTSANTNAATGAALDRWGPLTIVGLIGRGRFGDVYRAIDPRLDRAVALKLLRRDDRESPDAGAVIDEGRLLARVRHPNVVTVYGAERIESRVGLWMELVEGQTLEAELQTRGPLPWAEVARIGIDLCRALEAVHHAGLLHRDLKAQNILREPGGRVVLADFGASLALSEQTNSDLAGTPLYLAPEVFAGGIQTGQGDVYSLGVLLFHLVTGSYPVRGRSLSDLREAHQQRRRSHLRDARSDLPHPFIHAVDTALEFEPKARHHDAGAFERALRAVLETAIQGTSEVARPNVAADQASGRRGRLVAACGAILLVAAVALAAAGVRSRSMANRTGAVDMPTVDTRSASAPRKIRLPSFEMGVPSRDGRFFPYFAETGALQLWEVATGRSRQLSDAAPPGQRGRASVASPNGERVAYGWSLGDGAHELRLNNADGTWPQVLLTRQSAYEPVPVDWSRDGRDVLCWLRQKNGSADLVLVPVSGGTPRLIHTFTTNVPTQAQLSPDGRFVVVSHARDSSSPRGGVSILDARGAPPRAVVDGANEEVGLQWLPDGQHLLFLRDSREQPGSSDAWVLTLLEGVPQGDPTLLISNVGFGVLHVTSGGDLYQSLTRTSAEVYTASIDLTGRTAVGPPSRISQSEVGNHVAPAWSPDGRSIAYFTISEHPIPGAGPARVLTIQDMESGASRRLALPMAFLTGYRPTWAPDGRSVVIVGQDQDLQSRLGYYRVDLQSGTVSPLALPGNGDYPPFSEYSPDGRLFLYVDPSKGIVARRLSDGAESLLVPRGERAVIGRFFVAPDSHAVAFNSSIGQGKGWIIELQETNRPPRVITQSTGKTGIHLHGWTPDSRSLLYSAGEGASPYRLWRLPTSGGTPIDLGFSLTPTPNPISLRVDGRRIAYPERTQERELWIKPLRR